MFITHQDCPVKVCAFNTSPQHKTIKKGSYIATYDNDFEEINTPIDINTINCIKTQIDSIDTLCQKMTHLNQSEYTAAREVLLKHKHIFYIKRQNWQYHKINFRCGYKSDYTSFGRVPIHHRDIVQKLIARYEKLGLIEPIDSPFRASTVLVRKKNISLSPDVTAQIIVR